MRARIAASIVLAAGIVLGTAGCNLLAPQATLHIGEASDGVSGSVGSIDVRNAVLISENGHTANLVTTFVNNGSESQQVTVQSGTSTKVNRTVTVEPGQVKQVGGPGQTHVQFSDIDTQPGSLHALYFQYGSETGLRLLVPVLTNTLSQYNDYTATPTPKTTPKSTSTPLVTPTPTPTATSNG